MKTITVKPVTSEDLEVTVEFDGQHVYINSELSPIICSQEQADRLGEILKNPEKITDQ
jgi:hypothetical protein